MSFQFAHGNHIISSKAAYYTSYNRKYFKFLRTLLEGRHDDRTGAASSSSMHKHGPRGSDNAVAHNNSDDTMREGRDRFKM